MAKKEKEVVLQGAIETIKSKNRLPISGTPLQTVPVLSTTTGMSIKDEYLNARKPNAKGTYEGIVAGHGGDVWWVKHEDGTIAAYSFLEVTDVKE